MNCPSLPQPVAKRTELQGFSLVELSIVLVILGLLTGGILAGQSLIHAAELRSMHTEVTRYNTAVMAFRDKYFALPGDITNATAFWGTAGSCPGTFATPSTDNTTCNGNGDGQISWSDSWRAWQHLAAAGLVEGRYTGVQGSAGDPTFGTAGSNMPASRVESSIGYTYVWHGSWPTDLNPYFAGNYGNALRWGTGNGVDEGNNILYAEDAWNVDTKMDDGKPGTGIVRSYVNTNRVNCANSDVGATATYQVANTTRGCNLLFIPGF